MTFAYHKVRAVNIDQSTRIALAFARETARSSDSKLCTACVEVLGVTGAGVTIMGGNQAGPICVSNQRMAALEDLQFEMGEGPCQDAFRTGRAVHAPRLDVTAFARWPSFVDLAQKSGIGAVFAYPLSLQTAKIGVLTLYHDREGDLTTAQNDDSFALAEILTETVLSLQDQEPEGSLAQGLEAAVAYRAEIYQASGMVAIQLQISAADALLRIRAHAFTSGQTVATVASDIVTRRVRLSDDRPDVATGKDGSDV